MSVASFVIAPTEGGWGVAQANEIAGPYLTREAAFEERPGLQCHPALGAK
jgi:hypothetical protein